MQDGGEKEHGRKDKKKVVGEEDVVRWSSLGGMREMGSTGRSAANTSTREHAHEGNCRSISNGFYIDFRSMYVGVQLVFKRGILDSLVHVGLGSLDSYTC